MDIATFSLLTHPLTLTISRGAFAPKNGYCVNLIISADKMFSLGEFIKEGSIQTGNREEFYLLMPVPESHFSDLMTGYFTQI